MWKTSNQYTIILLFGNPLVHHRLVVMSRVLEAGKPGAPSKENFWNPTYLRPPLVCRWPPPVLEPQCYFRTEIKELTPPPRSAWGAGVTSPVTHMLAYVENEDHSSIFGA